MWSDWEEWSECTSSCNDGERLSKRRKLQLAQNNGTECQGDNTRTKTCNEGPCPGILCPHKRSSILTALNVG